MEISSNLVAFSKNTNFTEYYISIFRVLLGCKCLNQWLCLRIMIIFNLFFRWVLTSSARGSLPTLRTVSLTTRFFSPRTIFPIFVTSNLALRWKKGSPSTAWTSWPLLQPPQNGSSSASASSQALQCSSGSAPSSASSPTVSRCCIPDCPAVFLRFVCVMYVQINIRV